MSLVTPKNLSTVVIYATLGCSKQEAPPTIIKPKIELTDLNEIPIDRLAPMWFYANQVLSNENGAVQNLKQSASYIQQNFDRSNNKAACFWLAYISPKEEQSAVLEDCDFDQTSYDFLLRDLEELKSFVALNIQAFDLGTKFQIENQYFPNAHQCSDIDLDSVLLPISASQNNRLWHCIDKKDEILIRPQGETYSQDVINNYEEEFKVYHMLLDGYEDTLRKSNTGLALWGISDISEGMSIADVGCGPGLFTFEMGKQVGDTGQVYAIDINKSVLEFIDYKKDIFGVKNLQTKLTSPRSIDLSGQQINRVFLTQTYHALIDFEDPENTSNYRNNIRPFLSSIHSALADDGLLIIQDHTPSLQVVIKQITNAGFQLSSAYYEIDNSKTKVEAKWIGEGTSWVPYNNGDVDPEKNYVIAFLKK